MSFEFTVTKTEPVQVPLDSVYTGNFFIRVEDGELNEHNLFLYTGKGPTRLASGLVWDEEEFTKVFIVNVTNITGALA